MLARGLQEPSDHGEVPPSGSLAPGGRAARPQTGARVGPLMARDGGCERLDMHVPRARAPLQGLPLCDQSGRCSCRRRSLTNCGALFFSDAGCPPGKQAVNCVCRWGGILVPICAASAPAAESRETAPALSPCPDLTSSPYGGKTHSIRDRSGLLLFFQFTTGSNERSSCCVLLISACSSTLHFPDYWWLIKFGRHIYTRVKASDYERVACVHANFSLLLS